MSKVCAKHIESPAFIYGECIGCELETMRAEAQALREQNTKFQHMLADVVAKHFAENIKRSTAQKSMDVYLSEGIRLLEEEVADARRNAEQHEIRANQYSEELAALRARVVVPGNLLERCREILEWQETGILKGDALRNYCQSKIWGSDPSALRMGEGETAQEAYRFIDELARLNSKAVSEELLHRIADTLDDVCHGSALEKELRTLLGEGNAHD